MGVNTGDLIAITPGNSLCKFADDTYLIVPAVNQTSRLLEFNHIQSWAEENHLKLNRAKSGEVVFTDNRRRRKKPRDSPPPPTIPGIERRDQLRMLGVTIANDFTVKRTLRN